MTQLLLLVGALFCGSLATQAQQQAPMQVLHHHVRPAITNHTAALVAPLDTNTQLHLSVVLPLRNQAELTSLLQQLYDPKSPQYRHFLTVQQFTQQFGPTDQDYASVVTYLQSYGLSVGQAPANHLLVPLSGSASQVNAAFNVRMNLYQHPTENRTFFSPDREPSLRLQTPIAHISGLDTYSLPRPHLVRRSQNASLATPLTVTGSGPGGSYLGSDMRAAYYGGTQLDGTGQSVGLLEFGGYDANDVTLSFTNAGQSTSVPINNVLLDGATTAPDPYYGDLEQVLDIVQAIGMAPNLTQVRVYIGFGQDDANIINTMTSENIAKQLSCSWSWIPADPAANDGFFQEMAAQGQSFLTSSGDDGAYDVQVSPFVYPADDQYVTAVGGTHLNTNGPAGTWASEVVWNSLGSGSGGGVSTDGISLPSYQSGIANSANNGSSTLRNSPDVAMEADFDNFYCGGGTCANDAAGTSFAAPRWAGFIALVNQQAIEAGTAPAGGIGFLNPPIYQIAETSEAPNDLHDITSGNNLTRNQPVYYTATAGYDLTTGWGSPTGQNLINDLAGQQAPGFWLSSNPAVVQASPNSTATVTIRITDAGNFTGNVNLAVTSTLPSGVTAMFGSASATTSDVLTFTVSSSVAAQNIPVTVTGTSGSLTQTFTLTLSINTPSFTLSGSPAAVSVLPGSSINTTVTVLPQYGFTGTVGLAISGLPAGVTASFSPPSTTGTSTLTLMAASTATGGYNNLTITGTSGALTATTIVNLFVNAPNFSLQPSTSTLTTGANSTASTSISIYSQSGFSGNVTFTASNLPSGVTAAFSPNPASSYTFLTLTTNGTVQPGTTAITITGTSGSITSSTILTLQIMPPSFSLSTYNTNPSVAPGYSTSIPITISDAYGFSGNVDLYVSGLPSGTTALWSQNPASYSTTLNLYTSNTTPLGQYPITITGKAQGITASTTATLTVAAASFTISPVGPVNVSSGNPTYYYGYIQRLNGFNGNVNMSVSGLPAGVSLTFYNSPIPSSSNYYEMYLQATSAVAPGQYPVTITGTSGNITQSTTLIIIVPAPSFSLSGGASGVLNPGSSTTIPVSVYANNGFTGSVNLSVAGLPAGVVGSFSPNPATTSSTLILTASTAVASGQYTLTVTGTSGSQTQTTLVYLTIGVPSFSISTYSSVTIGQGASASPYLYAIGSNGFNAPVTFSASGMPAGLTVTFAQNPVSGSYAYDTMTITAATNLPVGQYPITITGTSGALTSSTTLTVTVAAPSFTLSAYGGTWGQASTATTYVYVYGQNGFSGSVNLSISGLPAGVTAVFSPASTTFSSALQFTIASTVPPGNYSATVTGTAGTETETTPLAFTIAAPSFALYGGLYYSSLNQGATTTGNVSVSPQFGFNGSVLLTASNLPTGVTSSFSPNPTTSASTITLSASGTTPPGSYNFTITGTSGSLTSSITNYVQVIAGSFSLLAAPNAVSLPPGSTAKSTVAISPSNGFSSPVTFTVSGLPAGVTAAFSSPTSTTGSVLTFSASSSAAVGSSTITITGTSGTTAAITTVTLNVAPAPVQQATSTSLSFTSNGSPVSTVASGTPVTVAVAVTAGSTPLTYGQVYLCPATAITCDAFHSVATAQITSTGNGAIFNFLPGAGVHPYVAAFAGTTTLAGSTSTAVPLTVPSAIPTTTTLTQAGMAGNYTLTATVTGTGDTAPTGSLSFLDTTASNDALATMPLTAGASTVTQSAGQSMSLAGSPGVTVAGDFNGDGKTDVALALSGNTVTILLSNGDGTFHAGSAIPFANLPTALAVGDFNSDGKADLVAVDNVDGYVLVYLGNGDGTFASSPVIVNTLIGPNQVLVADMNNDGFPDLLVWNYNSWVQVFYGNGAGAFTPSNFTASASGATRIATADFNGDGILDLALTTYNNNIGILLGNFDGSFTPTTSVAGPVLPGAIAIGDFNQDGKPDLAVGGSSSPGVLNVYLGNGDGTFSAAIAAPAGAYPATITVTDINNDGKQDLFVDTTNSMLFTFLGHGDGTFTSFTTSVPYQYGGSMITGDWNGDGVLDALVLNYYDATLQPFLTQVTETATAAATGVSPFGSGQHLIEAAYPGDAAYAASTSATVSLTAQPGPPTVTIAAPPATQTLQPVLVTVSVNAGAGYPVPTGTVVFTGGAYTSAPTQLNSGAATFSIPAGSLPAGSDALTAVYSPDAASTAYTTATGSASIAVSKLSPTITWPTPAPITYGAALTSTQLDATTSIPGSFTYTPGMGTSLLPGQQTLSVLFTPSDAANYSTATSSVTLTVNDVATTFSVTGIPAQADPGVTYNVTVSAIGVLAGPLSSFTGQVTLSSAGPGVRINPSTYNFTPADSGSHTFQVTFPAAGTYSLTATSGPLSGSETGITVLDMIWLVNSNGSLSQFDSAGTAVSSSSGYTGAITSFGPVAIDATGNVWSLSPSANAVVEYNSLGLPLSSSAGYTGAGLASPAALAVDGSGFIFIANGNGSLSVLSNTGSSVSPATGLASGTLLAPSGIAIDASGRLWISNGDSSVTEVFGSGAAPVITPTSSAVQSNTLGAQP